MRIVFSDQSWAEYLVWQEQGPAALSRVNTLIEECRRHPFKGRGKPEPLKGSLSGWWSRRITREHRLVYRVSGSRPPSGARDSGMGQCLEVAQLRFHY